MTTESISCDSCLYWMKTCNHTRPLCIKLNILTYSTPLQCKKGSKMTPEQYVAEMSFFVGAITRQKMLFNLLSQSGKPLVLFPCLIFICKSCCSVAAWLWNYSQWHWVVKCPLWQVLWELPRSIRWEIFMKLLKTFKINLSLEGAIKRP